ncbi:MAG: hypothetical protein J7M40_13680, partial [Planctomycetes bacterium]|nr:hypothetical protein [Planctomycetota bacterium]
MRAAISFYVAVFLFAFGSASGFNSHVATEGPVKVTIGEIDAATEFDKAAAVEVTVENSADAPIRVRLEMAGLVDEWYAVGVAEKEIALGAKEEKTIAFRIACRKGGLSALYPVHVYAQFKHAGKDHKVHCVQIFESDFQKAMTTSATSGEMPVNIVPARGVLSLVSLKTHRVLWRFFDQPQVRMPVGWKGTDDRSGTSFSVGTVYRETGKDTITMHPPWRGGAGTVFAEYLLKLPNTKKIEFHFANAIRDHSAEEPASDGVTFRVYANKENLFDRHTDSKVWLQGKVDLSRYAGKEILLRLESHPGPKRNTTCDSSYWAQPAIVTGEPSQNLTAAQRDILRRQARWHVNPHSVMSQRPRGPVGSKAFVFDLAEGCAAAVVPGSKGIFDAAIAFGKGKQCVVFDGIDAAILDNRIGEASGVMVQGVEYALTTITHHLLMGGKRFDLNATLHTDRGGLRIRFDCPQRITDLALGAADQKARRVYYGHGYYIEEPKAFRAGFGGHNLSTSHVGFDFAKGVSLLTATDNPPDYLEVTPDKNIYA